MAKGLDEKKYAGFLANPKDPGPKETVFTYYDQDVSQNSAITRWMPPLGHKYTIKKEKPDSEYAIEVLDPSFNWNPAYEAAVIKAQFHPCKVDPSVLVNTIPLDTEGAGDEEWLVEEWVLAKLSVFMVKQLFPNGKFATYLKDDDELICDILKWTEVNTKKSFSVFLGWVIYLT
ncbi:MAG: hypothetical protein AAGJ37_13685 [Pseudomonadota bacterium]